LHRDAHLSALHDSLISTEPHYLSALHDILVSTEPHYLSALHDSLVSTEPHYLSELRDSLFSTESLYLSEFHSSLFFARTPVAKILLTPRCLAPPFPARSLKIMRRWRRQDQRDVKQ